jgi:hypothetical protein
MSDRSLPKNISNIWRAGFTGDNRLVCYIPFGQAGGKSKMESINKRSRKIGPLDDKVIISSEYYENDRPSYICSICNMTLSRLSDAGGNNSTYWCRHCSVEFDPAEMLEENPSYQYLTET